WVDGRIGFTAFLALCPTLPPTFTSSCATPTAAPAYPHRFRAGRSPRWIHSIGCVNGFSSAIPTAAPESEQPTSLFSPLALPSLTLPASYTSAHTSDTTSVDRHENEKKGIYYVWPKWMWRI